MLQPEQNTCEQVATEFVKFYYNELNSHQHDKITNLYKEFSLTIFQDEKLSSNASIINKLLIIHSILSAHNPDIL